MLPIYILISNNCFFLFQLCILDFLEFRDVSFRASTNIGRLYEDLNNILEKRDLVR